MLVIESGVSAGDADADTKLGDSHAFTRFNLGLEFTVFGRTSPIMELTHVS